MPKKSKNDTVRENKAEKESISKEEELEDIVEEENEVDTEDMADILAAWEFPEFEEYQRGKLWYAGFGIVFLAMLVYSYFSDNLLFAIILIIFISLYLHFIRKKPSLIQTIMTEDGILIGEKFIPYEDFRSFYIIYHPPEIKNLYLETKSFTSPRITIPLEYQNPIYIREILLEYLDEDLEKEEIPTSEGISKILRL